MAANTAAPRSGSVPEWRSLMMIPLQILGTILLVVAIPIIFGMSWRNFEPLFEWTSLRFISVGAVGTIAVSLVAIIVSLPLAMGLALGRLSTQPAVSTISTAIIEIVRALPLLLLIFYINLRFPFLNEFENLDIGNTRDYLGLLGQTVFSRGAVAVAIALIVYTAAVNAELLRAGILSLEKGQQEAARSLGLSYWQMMRLIILPQAFRRILAPLIAQFTILLKDTSLGSIIGFLELQRRAQILYQRDFNPMEALYFVALIYFVLNYLLGLTSRFVERKRPAVEVRVSEM